MQVSVKGPGNFVSAADHKAEEIIFKELSKARPGYGFLMEERGEVEGDDKSHRWIVDPLDGTTNFLHGIPHFAISIGLERQGVLVAGVVYIRLQTRCLPPRRARARFSTTSAVCASHPAKHSQMLWWRREFRIAGGRDIRVSSRKCRR